MKSFGVSTLDHEPGWEASCSPTFSVPLTVGGAVFVGTPA
jgi:hypothetical protein